MATLLQIVGWLLVIGAIVVGIVTHNAVEDLYWVWRSCSRGAGPGLCGPNPQDTLGAWLPWANFVALLLTAFVFLGLGAAVGRLDEILRRTRILDRAAQGATQPEEPKTPETFDFGEPQGQKSEKR